MFIAARIYFWGGAIHTAYRIVAAPSELSGGAGQWMITAIDRDHPRREPQHWTARDTDGDGTWDEFLTPQGTFARPGLHAPPSRWLVVCLDGVPLAEMQSLWDRGHFREFLRPTAAISTFPSDTETALTEAIHALPVPGYEHVYFDRAANRLRGGVWVTLTGSGIPYIGGLDYDAPGWAKIVPYVVPRKAFRADINRLRNDFRASHAPVFVAHIASSDGLLHVMKMNQAESLLGEFESIMREIYLDARGDLGVIVFSDHGNTLAPSVPAPVEALLARRGWQVRDSIQGPRAVVVPSYGLVGFAAIYCRPEAIETLADDLRGVEGADLIVSAHGVHNPRGVEGHTPANFTATIRAAASTATADLSWSDDGKRYRYAAREGDPLGLVPVFDALRSSGKLDANGFANDSDLFAATSLTDFPDSAARIRAWATNHVLNSADILVSLKPGYYHGVRSFGRVVTLAGTHGGLEKSASLGFVMATYPLAPAIRLNDLIPAKLRKHF